MMSYYIVYLACAQSGGDALRDMQGAQYASTCTILRVSPHLLKVFLYIEVMNFQILCQHALGRSAGR